MDRVRRKRLLREALAMRDREAGLRDIWGMAITGSRRLGIGFTPILLGCWPGQ